MLFLIALTTTSVSAQSSEEIDEIRNTRQDINARILVHGGGNIEVFHAHRTSDGWDFTDADLVAFRIREAARQEKDAETRRKLWEEYGNYSLSAFGNCRLCDRDVLEASTALAGRGEPGTARASSTSPKRRASSIATARKCAPATSAG